MSLSSIEEIEFRPTPPLLMWSALFFLLGTGGFVWLNGFLLPAYVHSSEAAAIRKTTGTPAKKVHSPPPVEKKKPMPASAPVEEEKAVEYEPVRNEIPIEELVSRPIVFKPGSTTVDEEELPRVKAIAGYLLNNPGTRIEITGFGFKGSKLKRNRFLARQRARDIRSRLTALRDWQR